MSKKINSLIAMIVIFLCLFMYLMVYEYLLNNNMRVCMTHYKDYNYCKAKIND